MTLTYDARSAKMNVYSDLDRKRESPLSQKPAAKPNAKPQNRPVVNISINPPDRVNFRVMKKAGPLRNGFERGKGSVRHAVPIQYVVCGPALCGQQPAIQWSDCEGDQVTCPQCLKRIVKDA